MNEDCANIAVIALSMALIAWFIWLCWSLTGYSVGMLMG